MTRRIEFTVPDEVGEAYDQARGRIPMATWIKWMLGEVLESALRGGTESSDLRDSGVAAQPSSAPTRAPDVTWATATGDGSPFAAPTSTQAKQGVKSRPKGKR